MYTPLTQEQFQAAQKAGFSTDKIIAMEQQRKAEQSAPAAPPAPTPSPLGTVADLAKGALGVAANAFAPGATAAFSQLPKAPGQVLDAFKGGLGQMQQGFAEGARGDFPIKPALKIMAGGINAVSAPLAPVTAPLGAAINAVGDKVGDIPAVQKFSTTKAGEATASFAEDVGNASTVLGTMAGMKTPLAKGVKETVVNAPKSIPSVDSVLGRDPAGIIAKRTKELTKLEDSYSAVRKSTAKAKSQGIDTKNILAQTDLLHNAVDNTGTIRTQNAMHELNDFIKPQEKVISANLDREGVKLPFSTIKKSLTAAVDKSGLEGQALENAYTKVDAELAGLGRRVGSDGKISLSKIQDAKVNKYSTIDYMNEASKIADKTIARTYKQLVEDHTKSVDVQALNKELQSHYSVLSLLEKLDGKKVEGGKLGKYFAQTTGAMVGSHFGPLGAIAGAELGARLKGAAMSTKLSGKTGAGLSQSEAMKSAVAQSKSPPLMLPPGKLGAPKVSNNIAIPMGRAIADEKPTFKPDYSNSLGNLNQAQSTTMTNMSKGIIKRVPPEK